MIDRQDGPTVLVGHSFSGMTVTEVGAHMSASRGGERANLGIVRRAGNSGLGAIRENQQCRRPVNHALTIPCRKIEFLLPFFASGRCLKFRQEDQFRLRARGASAVARRGLPVSHQRLELCLALPRYNNDL
jgi:thioesterase domain-containing protein